MKPQMTQMKKMIINFTALLLGGIIGSWPFVKVWSILANYKHDMPLVIVSILQIVKFAITGLPVFITLILLKGLHKSDNKLILFLMGILWYPVAYFLNISLLDFNLNPKVIFIAVLILSPIIIFLFILSANFLVRKYILNKNVKEK